MLPFLIAIVLDVVAVLPAFAAPLAAADASPTARAEEATPSAHRTASHPSVCVVSHSTEARYRAYGYDHIVHLRNDCQRNARCTISTNVNPKRLKVRVNSGERIEVLTYRGSPSRVFSARVACQLGD